jgi:hypothetical protein
MSWSCSESDILAAVFAARTDGYLLRWENPRMNRSLCAGGRQPEAQLRKIQQRMNLRTNFSDGRICSPDPLFLGTIDPAGQLPGPDL